MKKNIRYRSIILSSLVAILLVSVAFGAYSPSDIEGFQGFVSGEIPEIDEEAPGDYETAIFGVWCFWGPDARVGVVDGVIRTRVGFHEVKDSVRDESGTRREVLQVDYDPNKISYTELYEMISETGQHRELHPFGEFILAGRFDQSHRLGRHEELDEGYQKIYPDLGDIINSTAVARVNGYLAGYGELDSIEDLEGLGLTEKGRKEVYDIWESGKI
ncbi:MAG: peptide-methionine (S)-S-oxide reductase [Thermoplasmata archaeon]